MNKVKPFRIFNNLKVINNDNGYSLYLPDLSECIYTAKTFDEKDFRWLADHINYHKGSDECFIEWYINGDDLFNAFYDGEGIVTALYDFNTKHNIKEIFDEYNFEKWEDDYE